MQPILSKLGERDLSDTVFLSPDQEITTIDSVYQSTLIRDDLAFNNKTDSTKVYRETTDYA